MFVLLAATGGCSNGPATVTGTVSRKNQPLDHGEIHFVGADGKSRSSVIGGDGSYRIDDAPTGQVRVAVVVLTGTGDPKLGLRLLPKPVTVVSSIPTKYKDPATSGLAYPVGPGAQTINVDLPD
jgi:hypothetical protein